MKISGKIIAALPPQGGQSKNGKEWSKQEYVLQTDERYPKKVAFSVLNEKIQKLGLAVGQDVDIDVDIDAREWQGKWYNSIICWNAVLRNPGQAQGTTNLSNQQQQYAQMDDLPY